MSVQVDQLSEDVTLYLGEAEEVLPTLSGVAAVITDPPYAAKTHDKALTNKGGGHGNKLVTFAHLTDAAFRGVVEQCLGAAEGWVVMTCDYRHAALFYEDARFIRLGAWMKPNPMPQISGDRPGQGFETVLILHAGRRPKGWNRGGGAGVWTCPVMNGAEVPTQKPLKLAMSFVADFTLPNELVADPFLGSGTTGVAAVRLGRRFIGIERDPRHFDIARRRIDEELRSPGLFSEPPPVATQVALL